MKAAFRSRVNRCVWACLVVAFAFTPAPPIAADVAWERSPYNVELRLDLALADLNESQRSRLTGDLARLVDARVRPFWDVHFVGEEHSGAPDKVFSLSVSRDPGGFRVETRERDEALDSVGPTLVADGVQPSELAERLLAAAFEAFRPIARFDRDPEDSRRVFLSYKGSAISPSPHLATAEADQLLAPYLRRRDRSGAPIEGGTKPIVWTYLIASPGGNGEKQAASVVSHTSRPFNVARRGRIDRLALVTPDTIRATTKLRLVALSDRSTPLSGYEALLSPPGSTGLVPLGFTDDQGTITLPAEPGVWMAHLKCGDSVVASLPLAPGAASEFVVPLIYERSRLRADLELASLREELIDTVARRKILAARLRRLLEADRVESAAELLVELESLPGRTHFARQLDKAMGAYKADHPIAQRRLDALFTKTRGVLGGAFDAREVRDLAIAVDRAKQALELRGGRDDES